jgi:hypothetical protein
MFRQMDSVSLLNWNGIIIGAAGDVPEGAGVVKKLITEIFVIEVSGVVSIVAGKGVFPKAQRSVPAVFDGNSIGHKTASLSSFHDRTGAFHDRTAKGHPAECLSSGFCYVGYTQFHYQALGDRHFAASYRLQF